MKSLILATLLALAGCSSNQTDSKVAQKEAIKTNRAPASIETKRLLEIDERRGCCSHHGGVSHCSFGTLYCRDGWASGCGC